MRVIKCNGCGKPKEITLGCGEMPAQIAKMCHCEKECECSEGRVEREGFKKLNGGKCKCNHCGGVF